MKKIASILIVPVLTMIAAGCYNDKAALLYPGAPCNPDTATYSGSVRNIMMQNCALSNCHDAATASYGIILDNYNGTKAVVTSNRLIGAINHSSGFFPMPKGNAKLDDCSIQKITKWAQAGALNN